MEELLALYQQYCEQVRHHQDERRTIANTLILVIGALVAITAVDQKLDQNDYPVFIALIVVGLFGAACMVKCHGLIRFYKNVATELATKFSIDVKNIEKDTKFKEPCFWKTIDHLRLWHLWLFLFLLVAVAGTYLAFYR